MGKRKRIVPPPPSVPLTPPPNPFQRAKMINQERMAARKKAGEELPPGWRTLVCIDGKNHDRTIYIKGKYHSFEKHKLEEKLKVAEAKMQAEQKRLAALMPKHDLDLPASTLVNA